MRRPPVPGLGFLLAVVLLLAAAYQVHDVLIPFLLSFAIAYLANPVIHFFEARALRRDQVVMALYLLIALGITLAANSVLPALSTELALLQGKVPLYVQRAQEFLQQGQHELALRLPIGSSLVEHWSLKMYNPVMEQLPKIPAYVLGLIPLFSLLFLVPFITFFLLMDSTTFLQNAIQLCPSRYVEQALHVMSEVDTALGNYIRGVLIIALAIGTASYAGLRFLGVEYALAVAALSGVSSLIPYLGAIMGAVVGGLVAFFQFHNVTVPLQVVLLFFGIRLGDEAFVQPLVSKHSVHLHPMLFLLALMVGGKVFGFVGLVFAVPAACVVKALLKVGWSWYSSETGVALPESVSGAEIPYT